MNGKWGKGKWSASYVSPSYIAPSIGGLVNGSPSSVSGPFISPVANIPGVTAGKSANQQRTLLNTVAAPAYTFGDAPRTAPYGLSGPGNYQLDLAVVRSFPLHITESTKLNFRAEWYNVTNHTLFAVASTVLGNSSFGQVDSKLRAATRKAAQFSARIEF